MRWPWVRRSELEEMQGKFLESNQNYIALARLHGGCRERMEQGFAMLHADDQAELARNAVVMASLAADLASLQSAYAALALGAFKPAPEPPLPTVSRDLDAAIRTKATSRNHRAALWAWAKARQNQGVSDVEIADAIAAGEADEDLLVEQERV